MRANFGRGPTVVSKKGSLKFISRCVLGNTRIHAEMHNSIVYIENGFRGVPVAVAYALLKLMLCFRSAMLVWSFTVNKISGTRHQPLLHAIRNVFVFVCVQPPIGIICKICCPLSDIHSTVVLEYAMWSSTRTKIPSDPVAGRVRGMVVGMVVGQGPYKQKTLSVTLNMVVYGGWSLVRVVVRQGFHCNPL